MLAIAAVILLIAAVLIVWAMNAGPHGDPKPSATDWISAVGQAIGAIGTAGALWLGAITFRRQVRDQHRAQASTVTVLAAKHGGMDNEHLVGASLPGDLPIYNVELVSLDAQGNQLGRKVKHVVVRDIRSDFLDGDLPLHEAYVTFTDSAGARWRRWSKGKLDELGPEPKDFYIAETPELPFPELNEITQKRWQEKQAREEKKRREIAMSENDRIEE